VKKAQTIPWLEIEKRYAALFTNRKGNVAKPLRLALGACLVQAEYGYSDEETALQIQENPYLQYFCGYNGYDDSKLPFDPSLMVYFRKRLTPEILGEINEMILSAAQKGEHCHDDDDDRGNSSNGGTMIVDATCALQYPLPQDASLLNEARKTRKSCWTSCTIRPMVASPALTAPRRTGIIFSSAAAVRKRRRISARRLGNSCAIWRGTLPPLTGSLLWAEHFPSGKTTGLWQSEPSTNSRSTCMTTAATLFQTVSSVSASRFSVPLCGARQENQWSLEQSGHQCGQWLDQIGVLLL
jgi:hypothetical protein